MENLNAVGFNEDNNGYYINASVPSNLNVYTKNIKQYIDNINFRNVIDNFDDLKTIYNNTKLDILTNAYQRLGSYDSRDKRCIYRGEGTYYNKIHYLNDFEYTENNTYGFSGPAESNYSRRCGSVKFIRFSFDSENSYWNISFGGGYVIGDYYISCSSGLENNTGYTDCIRINGAIIPFVNGVLKIRFYNNLSYEIIDDSELNE